jgi:hypothetical protein
VTWKGSAITDICQFCDLELSSFSFSGKDPGDNSHSFKQSISLMRNQELFSLHVDQNC